MAEVHSGVEGRSGPLGGRGRGNVTKVARELNLNPSTLRNWVERKRAEEAGAPTAEERAEIRELKRELERVTRERDILGNAVAYFSARDPKNG